MYLNIYCLKNVSDMSKHTVMLMQVNTLSFLDSVKQTYKNKEKWPLSTTWGLQLHPVMC